MKTPETIFLIEQEGRLTFAVTRPTSPTIADDQIHEYSLIEQPAIDANPVDMKPTNDQTLVAALRILAEDIQSDDGIANAAIFEAALRLEELSNEKAGAMEV